MEFEGFDYALERRLLKENPEFSRRHKECMSIFDRILAKYVANFPNFTDHSLIHSMNVCNYSNMLLKDNVEYLNGEEIYIYLMAVALHDIGMTVNFKEFDSYMSAIGQGDYALKHSDESISEITRLFHHEISAEFVKRKYELFDIPNEKYAYAISAVCRGHRKTDLYSDEEFPTSFEVEDGKKVNLSFLGALLRLADEMDLAQDRNPLIMYEVFSRPENNPFDIMKFRRAFVVKKVEVENGSINIYAEAENDFDRKIVKGEVDELANKLSYCKEVISKRSSINFGVERVDLRFC